ncbi:hypothetical protein P3T76_005859 [Phytophthora citrophthora]|uniref:Uncharacterized protein n=1 Tax=Phytophthora citrophthora TaxID=4793 RepID=A0AAD9GPR3_9STRA|nr:hypothetical protein P3T76_005859 [Phytophthora citrophthora]
MQALPDTFVLVAIMILLEFVRERFKDKGVPIEATARFEQRVPRLVAGANRCRAARPPWDEALRDQLHAGSDRVNAMRGQRSRVATRLVC